MLRLLGHALDDLLHHELESHALPDRSRVQLLDERAWQQEPGLTTTFPAALAGSRRDARDQEVRALLEAASAAPHPAGLLVSLARRSPPRPSRRPRSPNRLPGLASTHLREAFRQGLRDLGYVSRNVVIEYRSTGSPRVPALAAELRSRPCHPGSGTHALAAKQATRTVPISLVADPVTSALVGLARPGGTSRGRLLAPELIGKCLEFLKQAFRSRSVAVLVSR
jgi:hypothetical protein